MRPKDPKMTMRYTPVSLDYKRHAVAQPERIGSGITANLTTAGLGEQDEIPQVAENK